MTIAEDLCSSGGVKRMRFAVADFSTRFLIENDRLNVVSSFSVRSGGSTVD